ncbi:MocR-like pyridoxine biosynthesis transcription factor PdxR [Pseudodonghicola flavimaris]|uniref:PLP-dependent aminotransferase family protein n=1 Tax=Pseudodonghicola flavimaris TaxID=3050036 RepID=A0ABT7F2H3_9RHOB|nr:PLP-dependent aminotransferase family protein [Pseudodonghicola flavimaris]MDK3018803.1 PLP-dependent aminotransferase family protein [Pseudodonghicola flavimaris]
MARDPLALDIDRGGGGPLFLAIAAAIVGDITRGRLVPGQRLPGTRALARELGVHRNTVDAAYQELLTQGWLRAQPARGTFVAEDLPQAMVSPPPVPAAPEPEPHSPALAFTDGAPDPRLVPDKALARAFRRALLAPAFRSGSDYGDLRGTPALRRTLAAYLASDRGVVADPARLLIARGSQMALFLAARAVLVPGETIAVEAPGYPLAWEAFRAAGATIRGVPVDAGGLQVEALETALARDPGIRAVYVTPHHQYPTTVTMGAARRLQLLELAQRHRLTLIEDDYDHEYRFEGRPVLPLAARAPADLPLIYIGSLSKLLSPGIRLGYALAPEPVLARMAAARAAIDRQGDTPLEAALAELIRDGDLGRHARKARRIYRARRDLLAEALTRRLGDRVHFDLPAGGLALWLCSRGAPAEPWAERAGRDGLALLPGTRFTLDAPAPQAFRLGYAALEEAQIARAVEILARSWPGGSSKHRDFPS